jgi:hypothetical protein
MKALLTLAAATALAQTPLDFRLEVFGSPNVTAGYSTVIGVRGTIIAGTDEQATPSIAGLPAGASARWWALEKHCCGTSLWRIATDAQPVQIFVSATVPPAVYPLTVTYKSSSGVVRSVGVNLRVTAPVVVAKLTPPADTALAASSVWLSNLKTYAAKHCTDEQAGIDPLTGGLKLFEGLAWYYDGARVYAQAAKTLNDPAMLTCSDKFATVFRRYIAENNGGIPGWRVFPHGVKGHFDRSGDVASKDAVLRLHDANGYASGTVASCNVIPAPTSRETSYAIELKRQAAGLGRALDWKYSFLIDAQLGHLDMWFGAKTDPYVQPFMVALAAEALIEHFEATQDARVLPALKQAADAMWATMWHAGTQAFVYETGVENSSPFVSKLPPTSGAKDLNLLIAPLYGWLFRQTGDPKYRTQGDAIFTGGVNGASEWLYLGKQFSQNYRWSGKYLEWRGSGTVTPTTTPTPTPTPTPTKPKKLKWWLTVSVDPETGETKIENVTTK